jgi:hypothetical protein
MSTKPARTKPQLATGPQKWVVLGPTGLFRNAFTAVDMANQSILQQIQPHLVVGRRRRRGREAARG